MKVHEYREMMRYLTRKPIDKEIAQAVDVKERVRETTPFYQKPKELVQDDKPVPSKFSLVKPILTKFFSSSKIL